MASLADLYSTSSGGMLGQVADFANGEADNREDAGLATQRLLHNYGTRALPQLVNRLASRGTFYSGPGRVQADQLREDVGEQQGDIQRLLGRQLAQLARNRVLLAAGVQL